MRTKYYYARSCAVGRVLVRVRLALLRSCGVRIDTDTLLSQLFDVIFFVQMKCYTLLYTFP